MEREISVFGKIRFSSLVPVVELDRGQHRPGESAATVIATIQIREFSFLLFSSLSISPIFLSSSYSTRFTRLSWPVKITPTMLYSK